MSGIDPINDLQAIASQVPQLRDREAIGRALDDLDYLMEVLDPELQEHAYRLHELLQQKLDAL